MLGMAGIAPGGDGPDARFGDAWRSLGHGETTLAADRLRAIVREHPEHAPTRRLVAALDRLAVPSADVDPTPTLDDLPGRWQVARGPHVLLIHRDGPEASAARVELLERVTTTYYLLFAGLGFDLPAPRRRLVAVRFDRPEEFRSTLRDWGGSAFEADWGCYLPARHLVATRAARGPSAAGPGLETAAATHEMVHQLVAESGLEPRPGAFPSWLGEGLAAQFEPTDGPRWAGFLPSNTHRLDDCRRGDPSPPLVPMLTDAGHGRPAYGPAWALVHLLLAEEPASLAALIDQLRGPADLDVEDCAIAASRRALGADLGPLEARWRSHMRGPLDGSSASR